MRLPALALVALALTALAPDALALKMKKRAIPNGGTLGIEVAGTEPSLYGRAHPVVPVSSPDLTPRAHLATDVRCAVFF